MIHFSQVKVYNLNNTLVLSINIFMKFGLKIVTGKTTSTQVYIYTYILYIHTHTHEHTHTWKRSSVLCQPAVRATLAVG